MGDGIHQHISLAVIDGEEVAEVIVVVVIVVVVIDISKKIKIRYL